MNAKQIFVIAIITMFLIVPFASAKQESVDVVKDTKQDKKTDETAVDKTKEQPKEVKNKDKSITGKITVTDSDVSDYTITKDGDAAIKIKKDGEHTKAKVTIAKEELQKIDDGDGLFEYIHINDNGEILDHQTLTQSQLENGYKMAFSEVVISAYAGHWETTYQNVQSGDVLDIPSFPSTSIVTASIDGVIPTHAELSEYNSNLNSSASLRYPLNRNSNTLNNGVNGTDYNVSYINNSAHFNGSSWINLGNNEYTNITGNMTVSFWVYQPYTLDPQMYVYKGTGWKENYAGYDFYYSSSLGFTWKCTNTSPAIYANAPAVFDRWVHLTGTFSDNGFVRVYVDGMLGDEASTAGQVLTTNPNDLILGKRYRTAHPTDIDDYKFNGSMYGLRIFDRELNSTEVYQNYIESCADTVQLEYNFNNGSTDSSGYNRDGTAYSLGYEDSSAVFTGTLSRIIVPELFYSGNKMYTIITKVKIGTEPNTLPLYADGEENVLRLRDFGAEMLMNSFTTYDRLYLYKNYSVGDTVMVAGVYDGHNMTLYMNGETESITPTGMYKNSAMVPRIGVSGNGMQYLTGNMSYLHVYDGAMSKQQLDYIWMGSGISLYPLDYSSYTNYNAQSGTEKLIHMGNTSNIGYFDTTNSIHNVTIKVYFTEDITKNIELLNSMYQNVTITHTKIGFDTSNGTIVYELDPLYSGTPALSSNNTNATVTRNDTHMIISTGYVKQGQSFSYAVSVPDDHDHGIHIGNLMKWVGTGWDFVSTAPEDWDDYIGDEIEVTVS